MTNWRAHLTPDETQWLADYAKRKAADGKERRRITDRAKKRAKRAKPE